jgi:hypothetical protein
MNINLDRAVTDITGKTGTAIIESILSGERDPLQLARHRDGRYRKSILEIAACLDGVYIDENLYKLSSSW